MKRYGGIVLIGAILLLSATAFYLYRNQQSTVKPCCSFYYWRTSFALSDKERAVIRENNVSRLYIRLFDVDYRKGNVVPCDIIRFEQQCPVAFCPVIYISNKALEQGNVAAPQLADSIYALSKRICEYQSIKFDELQLDCDWTESTREQYFGIIQTLRSRHPDLRLSCTIRLHQVKYYEKTGIPDVKYGVLMYYNMGRIGSDHHNSIYDPTIAAAYLKRLKAYPKALKVALPIFSWCIQLQDSLPVALIAKVPYHKLFNATQFQVVDSQFVQSRKGQYFRDHYFQENARVKYEGVNTGMLNHMIHELRQHLSTTPEEVIYYDLDERNFDNLPYEKGLFNSLLLAF